MTTEESTALLAIRELRSRRFALALSAFAALIALTVLLGWSLDIEIMRRFGIGSVVMLPITAICFLFAATALALKAIDSSSTWRSKCSAAFSALVLALGALMLAQRAGGFDLGINTLLFPDDLQRYDYRPLGLMAANSALAITLLGGGLCLFDMQLRQRRVANGLALGVVVIASIALVGYAYGVRSLYSFDQYAAMAPSTALSLVALGVAVIIARPDDGIGSLFVAEDAGAIFTRRMLPIALALPFFLGLAWLAVRRSELLGRETAVAMVVVLIASIYTAFLFHSARSVSALDRACRNALTAAEQARTRAEDANRGKAEFLTMMSHELRTPLNAIRGYTQLIEIGVRGPVTEEQRADLAKIRRSEEHLLSIIRDILDFASVERGQYAFEIAPVALPSLLESAVSAVSPNALAKSVSIVQDGWSTSTPKDDDSGTRLTVLADEQKLRQALINLLSNAIRFANPGSEVVVAANALRDGVRISISETGRGIPADRLATIFEPFSQIEPTLTRTMEGIGLGLAISRQLLRGMGSDVQVESTPGIGSRFSILLRAAPTAPPRRTSGEVAGRPSMGAV
jgi:signal transduction histidine kinase